MCFFSKKRKQEFNYLEKLKKLGIDFYVYSHEDEVEVFILHPVGILEIRQPTVPLDITIDKVGKAKPTRHHYYTITGLEVGAMDNIRIEKNSKKFELSLSITVTSERDVKDKVNIICSALGSDISSKVGFNEEDSEQIRSGKRGILRTWMDADGHTIKLYIDNQSLSIIIGKSENDD